MSSTARETMLPLNTNSKFKKLLYLIKKHNFKIATILIGGICLIFSVYFWFKARFYTLQLIPIRFIPFTVILLFVGIYKKRPWLFLPFLWFMGSLIFLNILSYGLGISAAYAYIKDYGYISGRIYDSFDWTLFTNVILIPLSFCCYLITNRCYQIFVEKSKFEYHGNDFEDLPEAETHSKWCFGFPGENGTLIICGISILFCALLEIGILIKDNFEINFNAAFPLFCVTFSAFLAIIGYAKNKSCLFLPILWLLETFVFLSWTLLINIFMAMIKGENSPYNYEKSMMLNNIYPYKYWIKLMFFETVLQPYLMNIYLLKAVCFLICIISIIFTTWLFMIVHSCYMQICDKNRLSKLAHASVEEC